MAARDALEWRATLARDSEQMNHVAARSSIRKPAHVPSDRARRGDGGASGDLPERAGEIGADPARTGPDRGRDQNAVIASWSSLRKSPAPFALDSWRSRSTRGAWRPARR